MSKLCLIALCFLLLPLVAGQEAHTVTVYGYSWPQQTITVNIPQTPQYAHSMVVQGMNEWNQALDWFMKTYYPQSQTPYQLVESSSGPVTVTFTPYSATLNYAGLTTPKLDGPQGTGYFAQMLVQIVLPPGDRSYGYGSTDTFQAVINHELGHVLGLEEAPASEISDLMCLCGSHTSNISTLDLYAVLVGSGVGKTVTVTLPQNIPYSYFDMPVPEFPYALVLPFTLFVYLVATRCKPQAQRKTRTSPGRGRRASSLRP